VPVVVTGAPLAGKRILIATASNWPSTAALPRLYGRGGAHVTVLCHPAALVALSAYTNAVVPVDGALAATVSTLREHLRTHAYDWIVAGDDPLVTELLREPDRAWLRPWFPFDPEDPAAIGFATSKHAFLDIARAWELPIADYELCATPESFASAAARFGFPFVAKARTGHAGGMVHRIDDLAAARAIWDRYGGAVLAAQRFVHGRVGTIEVLWDHGVPRCFMGAYKVDCHPSDFGAASAKQPFRDPALEAIARKVGAITGYHGFGAIDIMHDDRTRAFSVLELNPRPSGGGFTLTGGIARGFYPAYRAFLDGAPFANAIDLGSRSAPVPLFPNTWYYFVELADKRRPRAWLRAAEALARAPFDDRRLVLKYLRVFAGYYAERSALGKALKNRIKRIFRLTSIRHPGAVYDLTKAGPENR